MIPRSGTTLRALRRTNASALRDALLQAPHLRGRVTVTDRAVTFHGATPAQAVAVVDQLRDLIGVTRGRVGHPYQSLHAVRRRLADLAAAGSTES